MILRLSIPWVVENRVRLCYLCIIKRDAGYVISSAKDGKLRDR